MAVESQLRPRFERALAQPDLVVRHVEGGSRLVPELTDASADLVVVSETLLPASPRETLAAMRTLAESPELVLVVDREDGGERAGWLAAGAMAVLPATLEEGQIRQTFRTLVRRRRDALILRRRAAHAVDPLGTLTAQTSESSAMAAVLATAHRVAGSDSSLLILGETGTGKEWLARGIHAASPRAQAPFVAINCAALTESLLESQLFGHERGAFTGAERSHRGHFEAAHRGTLFLDEIGDMAPNLQAKLLRAVENRTIQRLGSETTVTVDVRVLAATHHDLRAAIAARSFRADLYYRLAVVELTLPPLRERRPDIPSLARRFLAHHRDRLARVDITGLTDAALAALAAHQWPGNVRELTNVIERAVLLCEGPTIELTDLPQAITHRIDSPGGFSEGLFITDLATGRRTLTQAFEREYLHRLLKTTHGRMGKAAQHAGIDVRTLRQKLGTFGLDRKTYRFSP